MDISTLAIKVVSTGIKTTVDSLKTVETQADKTEKGVEKLTKGFNALELASKALGSAILVGTMKRLAEEAIRMGDAWVMMQAKLRIATGSISAAVEAQEMLYNMSQQLRTPLEETTKLYTRLVPALQGMGKSSQDAANVTEGVALALKLSGATAAEASSVMLQFSQAMNAGKLNGAEFNAVAEGAPLILKALEESLGKTRGELKKMGAEGKLSSVALTEALDAQLPKWRKQFESLPLTFDGAMTQLKNTMLKSIGQFNEATKFTEKLAAGVKFVADNIGTLAQILGTVFLLALAAVIKKLYDATIGSALYTAALQKQAKTALEAAIAEQALAKSLHAKNSGMFKTIDVTDRLNRANKGVIDAELALASTATQAGKATMFLRGAFAFLTGPIGITITLLSTLAALLYQNKDETVKFGETTATVGQWVEGTWVTITEAVSTFASKSVELFNMVADVFKGTFVEKIVQYNVEAVKFLINNWREIGEFLVLLFPRIGDKFIQVFQAIGTYTTNITKLIMESWSITFSAIGKALDAIKAGDFVGAFNALKGAVTGTAQAAENFANNTGKAITESFKSAGPLEKATLAIGRAIADNTQRIVENDAAAEFRAGRDKRRASDTAILEAAKKKAQMDALAAQQAAELAAKEAAKAEKEREKNMRELTRLTEAKNKIDKQAYDHAEKLREINEKVSEEYSNIARELQEQIDLQALELQGIEQTEEAKARLIKKHDEETIALLKLKKAQAELNIVRAMSEGPTTFTQDAMIRDAEEKLTAINAEIAGLEKIQGLRETIIDQAIAKDWQADATEITDVLTGALRDAFDNGSNFASNFWKGLKNLFKEKLLLKIEQSLTENIGGFLQQMFGGSGSGGGGFNFGDMGSWIEAGKSIWSGFSEGGFSGAIQNIGSLFGMGGASGGAGAAAGGSSGAMAGLGTVAWVAAIAMGMKMSGEAYDEGFKNQQSGYGNGAAGAIAKGAADILTLTPVLEKIVGGKLANIITGSSLAQKIIAPLMGEQRGGGQYGYAFNGVATNARRGTTVSGTGATFLEGPGGGEIAGDQVRKAIESTVTGINSMLKNLGSSASLIGFQAGLETSDKDRGGVFSGGTLSTGAVFGESGQGDNYAGTLFEKTSAQSVNAQQAVENFSADLMQVTIQALQAATDIPQTIKSMLKDVNAEALTAEAAEKLLNDITAQIMIVNQFGEAVKGLPFANLKNLSFDATSSLLEMAGGLEQFNNKLGSYYENFYTETERTDVAMAQMKKVFADLNVVAPASRQAFRALVEAQDLSTEAGRKTYNTLLSVAGAFADLYPELQNTASSVAGLKGQLQSTFDTIKSQMDGLIAKRQELSALGMSIEDSIISIGRGIGDPQFDVLAVDVMKKRYTDAQKSFANATGDGIITAGKELKSAIENRYQAEKTLLDSNFSRYKTDFDKRRNDAQALAEAQQQSIQTQLDAAMALNDIYMNLKDVAQGLLLSELSPRTMTQRVDIAKESFDSLLQRANAGDTGALSKLGAAGEQYLQEYIQFAPRASAEYGAEFDRVQQALSSFGSKAADPTALTAKYTEEMSRVTFDSAAFDREWAAAEEAYQAAQAELANKAIEELYALNTQLGEYDITLDEGIVSLNNTLINLSTTMDTLPEQMAEQVKLLVEQTIKNAEATSKQVAEVVAGSNALVAQKLQEIIVVINDGNKTNEAGLETIATGGISR